MNKEKAESKLNIFSGTPEIKCIQGEAYFDSNKSPRWDLNFFLPILFEVNRKH